MPLSIQFGKIRLPLETPESKVFIANIIFHSEQPQPFVNTIIDYTQLTESEKKVFDDFKVLLETKINQL